MAESDGLQIYLTPDQALIINVALSRMGLEADEAAIFSVNGADKRLDQIERGAE